MLVGTTRQLSKSHPSEMFEKGRFASVWNSEMGDTTKY